MRGASCTAVGVFTSARQAEHIVIHIASLHLQARKRPAERLQQGQGCGAFRTGCRFARNVNQWEQQPQEHDVTLHPGLARGTGLLVAVLHMERRLNSVVTGAK